MSYVLVIEQQAGEPSSGPLRKPCLTHQRDAKWCGPRPVTCQRLRHGCFHIGHHVTDCLHTSHHRLCGKWPGQQKPPGRGAENLDVRQLAFY